MELGVVVFFKTDPPVRPVIFYIMSQLTGHMGHEATKAKVGNFINHGVKEAVGFFKVPADQQKKNASTGFLGWFFGGVFGVKMGGRFLVVVWFQQLFCGLDFFLSKIYLEEMIRWLVDF